MNAQTTFQPLYIRRVSGCIIVANTSNVKSLERAHKWKEFFDKKTKIPNEPVVPAAIFINHDEMEKNPDILSSQMQNYQQLIKTEKNGPSSSPDFFHPLKKNDLEDKLVKDDDDDKNEN